MKHFPFLIPLLAFATMASAQAGNGAFTKRPVPKSCCVQACPMPSRATAVKASYASIKTTGSHTGEMVLVKGGRFAMGSNDFADSKPLHRVTVSDFWMDEHEVTNAQFAAFVKATGYVTVAERKPGAKDYPGVPDSLLVAGSAVFTPPLQAVPLTDPLQWWQYIAGADWRHPLGPQSNIEGKEHEPVVQVCYEDAAAYARWAGKRLPTEAEWEYAARAGGQPSVYYWGNELAPNDRWPANIFQGNFPDGNTAKDGFRLLAPVKSFPPNAFGLYDMDGNVWEWCSDFYRADYYGRSPQKNPKGPADSYDADEPGREKHVQRGGSFLCSDQYCVRYKAGSRGKGETTSASNNLGFRCVKDAVAKEPTLRQKGEPGKKKKAEKRYRQSHPDAQQSTLNQLPTCPFGNVSVSEFFSGREKALGVFYQPPCFTSRFAVRCTLPFPLLKTKSIGNLTTASNHLFSRFANTGAVRYSFRRWS